MEAYHKIQTLFKRDLDGSLTGKNGKMINGEWTTPELEYLAKSRWEFTEKVDGTNIRVGYNLGSDNLDRVEFAGRTDNAAIPAPLLAHLEDKFTPGLFKDAELNDIVLFGEGYGPKIQGGARYREGHSFVLFDVKIGPWWLDRNNVDDIAVKLGIDSVPTIGHGTLYDAIDIVSTGLTWDQNGRMTNWGRGVVNGGLKSTWGNFEAEGIVARPEVPMFNRKGERIICKVKAVDFR